MSDFPNLQNFFSAWFHQDWSMEHGTPDAVVDDYRDGEDAGIVASTRKELAQLRERGYDEPALGSVVRGLGCEYDPTRDNGTWGGWLDAVAARLEG